MSDPNLRAYAEYTYTYKGKQYTGTRVAIYQGGDKLGNFQQDMGKKLEAAKGSTIAAYVDPEEPAASIINRDMRWMIIILELFFAIICFASFNKFVTYTPSRPSG